MATPRTQDFKTHTRWVPGYHFVTSVLVLVFLIMSIWRAATAPSIDTFYMLAGAGALFGVYAYTRVFPLKAQDRIIRLEERLRLARVLPADLQPHLDSISAGHLIALRFASDDEVPELVRIVVANPTIKPADLKRNIKSWRADWFRV
jgi:hypothetical protein